MNHCTYCKTKQARGDLRSFSLDALIERAKQAFGEGCKEIWLTSEDLGAYGRDIGLVGVVLSIMGDMRGFRFCPTC